MRKSFTGAKILVLALIAAFGAFGNGRAEAVQPIRVLFIGNSFTMFNDMPDMVAHMAHSLGYDLRPEVVAVGGKSLSYHRHSAKTLEAIDSAQWDAVILQDHSRSPSRPPWEIRLQSLPDIHFLVDRIRWNRPSTRIIYYETWGHRDGDVAHCLEHPEICSFDVHTAALQKGYRLYQKETGGDIAQVGTHWQRVVHDDAHRPFAASTLWLNDGAHPSSLGSYLAAATILRAIIDAPVGASDFTAGLPKDAATYLRGIADTQ
jgi:hypothetical protein